MTPDLYGTPRSHFTRIVRILCLELDLEVREIDVGNVGGAELFAGNPLMAVPVLVDAQNTIFDSHDICRYLVQRQGRDPLGVDGLDWAGHNMITVIRGVMTAEVRLILAARCGMDTTVGVFVKAREVLRSGLAWIDARIEEPVGLTYAGVCTVAMWDHLVLYELAEPNDAPSIARLATRLDDFASVAQTKPVR